MNTSSSDKHKVVLVTGFGPILTDQVQLNVNPSGEAVKLMRKAELELEHNITLVTRRVPVEYKYIDQNVPKMWQEYLPDLTIHVGVSNTKKGFTLETQARKAGYIHPDNTKETPDRQINPALGPDNIATDLKVDLISKHFNSDLSEDSLKSYISNEAGNFLCEYIYYTSLCQQPDECRNTLFVHVPHMESQKEFKELARGLERLVGICVAQIRNSDRELRWLQHSIVTLEMKKVCDTSQTFLQYTAQEENVRVTSRFQNITNETSFDRKFLQSKI